MNTPLAEFIVLKRRQRKLRQQDLAGRLGVGASYLCAVEGGRRLPRSKIFWKHVSQALGLDESEDRALLEALRRSAPTLKIPTGTSKEIRDILFDLADHGDSLPDELLEIVRIAAKASQDGLRKEKP